MQCEYSVFLHLRIAKPVPRAEEKLCPFQPQGGVLDVAWVVVSVWRYPERWSHAPQGADIDIHFEGDIYPPTARSGAGCRWCSPSCVPASIYGAVLRCLLWRCEKALCAVRAPAIFRLKHVSLGAVAAGYRHPTSNGSNREGLALPYRCHRCFFPAAVYAAVYTLHCTAATDMR